ncbi:hypothetical protein ACPB67_31925 [Micromonospora taraxaci]|uniref:hypothetical protein n=1 Tax=Micromonospora taraxaci TaxID=1316803 RepID=UPI003C2B842D
MTLLVPADPLQPPPVRGSIAPEADAARAAGIDVAVVDHHPLTRGDPHRAGMAVPADGVAVHHGWMLRNNQ